MEVNPCAFTIFLITTYGSVRTFTYAEASTQINRLANAFVSSGIKRGDRVDRLSKSSIEYAFMYYAGFRSGVVTVPLNYRLAPPEWAYIINDSQSECRGLFGSYRRNLDRT